MSRVNIWVSLIGLILLLVGIYGSVKTIINFTLFEKYPSTGVLSVSFMPMYYPGPGAREEDCTTMYYAPYPPGDMAKLTEEEKKEMKEQAKVQERVCVSSVKESREQAKVNDISTSLLALFLGGGVLVFRKKLFAESV